MTFVNFNQFRTTQRTSFAQPKAQSEETEEKAAPKNKEESPKSKETGIETARTPQLTFKQSAMLAQQYTIRLNVPKSEPESASNKPQNVSKRPNDKTIDKDLDGIDTQKPEWQTNNNLNATAGLRDAVTNPGLTTNNNNTGSGDDGQTEDGNNHDGWTKHEDELPPQVVVGGLTNQGGESEKEEDDNNGEIVINDDITTKQGDDLDYKIVSGLKLTAQVADDNKIYEYPDLIDMKQDAKDMQAAAKKAGLSSSECEGVYQKTIKGKTVYYVWNSNDKEFELAADIQSINSDGTYTDRQGNKYDKPYNEEVAAHAGNYNPTVIEGVYEKDGKYYTYNNGQNEFVEINKNNFAVGPKFRSQLYTR